MTRILKVVVEAIQLVYTAINTKQGEFESLHCSIGTNGWVWTKNRWVPFISESLRPIHGRRYKVPTKYLQHPLFAVVSPKVSR